MDLSKLSRLAGDAGLALVQRSEHHYQLTEPKGAALVDVWPSTDRFRRHNAPEGKKATTGNELSVVECARRMLPPKASSGGIPISAFQSASNGSLKRLPDSPGWWISEGMSDPVKLIDHPDSGNLYSAAGGVAIPGRWLKVEMPTFPPREQAPYRLCWAKVSGLGLDRHFLMWSKESNGFFRNGFYSTDQVTDVAWITPEFLDELPAAKTEPVRSK